MDNIACPDSSACSLAFPVTSLDPVVSTICCTSAGSLGWQILGRRCCGRNVSLSRSAILISHVVPKCLLDEFLGPLVKVPNRVGEGQVHRLQRVQSVLPDGYRHQIASLARAARNTGRYALRGMRRVRDALPDADFASLRSPRNATCIRDH